MVQATSGSKTYTLPHTTPHRTSHHEHDTKAHIPSACGSGVLLVARNHRTLFPSFFFFSFLIPPGSYDISMLEPARAATPRFEASSVFHYHSSPPYPARLACLPICPTSTHPSGDVIGLQGSSKRLQIVAFLLVLWWVCGSEVETFSSVRCVTPSFSLFLVSPPRNSGADTNQSRYCYNQTSTMQLACSQHHRIIGSASAPTLVS